MRNAQTEARLHRRRSTPRRAKRGFAWVLEPTHQDQNQHNHQNEAQTATRAIAPTGAVTPHRNGAQDRQYKDDQKYQSEHRTLPALVTLATLNAGGRRKVPCASMQMGET